MTRLGDGPTRPYGGADPHARVRAGLTVLLP